MSAASRRWGAAAVAALAAAVCAPAEARAVEPFKIKGEPVTLDITNTLVFNYLLDNRNDAPFRPSTKVDDYRAEWIDRLNVEARYWRFRAGVRLDLALYADELQRGEVRDRAQKEIDEAVAKGIEPPSIKDYQNQYFRELHSRFVQTFYPAKLWLGYQQAGLEVTAGDFYVQLGRGLVFSVRKIDELAIDTTVRGGRVLVDQKAGPLKIAGIAFAGQMNPARIDEVSGRRLHGDDNPLFFAFPTSGTLKTYEYDPNGQPVAVNQPPRPSYLADTVAGGRLEMGPQEFQIAANASFVLRQDHAAERLSCRAAAQASCAQYPPGSYDETSCIASASDACDAKFPSFALTSPQHLHNQIRTFSASVNVPKFGKGNYGDLYVEVAGQQLTDGRVTAVGSDGGATANEPDRWGYGIYANANLRLGPVSTSLEFKHYRSFFPLSANIDTVTPGFGAPEFLLVSYNQVPTAEQIFIEPIGNPNVCNTGGRGRLDWNAAKDFLLFGWVGYYASWSEFAELNFGCDTKDENRTNTWDTAAGLDVYFDKGKSHAKAFAGLRVNNLQVPQTAGGEGTGETDVFYREGYLRYDVTKHLSGKFSLQLVGWHRNRHRPATFADPWFEGENYTVLQWAPYLSGAFGFEYLAREGCQPGSDQFPCFYFNGQIQYRAQGNDKWVDKVFNQVRLYFGQRRGALRCVSGVCRTFPPLEGAQLEWVSRF